MDFDNEKNLQLLLAAINWIMLPLILIIAGMIVYFFFNQEILRAFIKLLVPVVIYSSGLGITFWVRKRKAAKMKEDQGPEVRITLNYFTFFWHDALVFITPSIIIIAAFWLRGEVTYYDILYSGIAMTGLYLSELIYKRKIT